MTLAGRGVLFSGQQRAVIRPLGPEKINQAPNSRASNSPTRRDAKNSRQTTKGRRAPWRAARMQRRAAQGSARQRSAALIKAALINAALINAALINAALINAAQRSAHQRNVHQQTATLPSASQRTYTNSRNAEHPNTKHSPAAAQFKSLKKGADGAEG